jgi:hypothetical protein
MHCITISFILPIAAAYLTLSGLFYKVFLPQYFKPHHCPLTLKWSNHKCNLQPHTKI